MLSKLFITFLPLIVASSLEAGERNFIKPDDDGLTAGRDIWIDSCSNCHAHGVADAPVPMIPSDWVQRVKKSNKELYQNAINGFIGPDYSMMPPRGGNEELDDDEVRAAVDYMLFLADYYIEQDKRFIKLNKGEL